MIDALRYEPQGQRQRFEQQQEQQQQDRHIHLHLHLDLTFRVSQRRSTTSSVRRLTRIFAAIIAAPAMPLGILLVALAAWDGPFPAWVTPVLISILASLFAGLALALSAFGRLLLDVWRTSPRERVGLVLRLVLSLVLILLIPFSFLLLPGSFLPFPLSWLLIRFPAEAVLLCHPLITALLLAGVSREAGALRQETPAHSKSGFALVAGMALLLLGGLILNITAALTSGASILLPAICLAIIVALFTLVKFFRSRKGTPAHPKDAFPSGVEQS